MKHYNRSMDTRRDALHSRVFDGLNEAARRDCLARGALLTVRRGHWVARQGEPATTFYIVDDGALKILQDTAQGQELIVRFVGPGDPFGGVVALESAPYPVSALAVEATRLFAWTAPELRGMLDAHPAVRANLMREMTAHMTDALTRVRELTTLRVGRRLAITLMRLARHCGRQTPDGILITHPLTRQELADLVGTTLYTVSRTLSQWQSEGVLRSDRQQLILRSPKAIARLADEA
jgi:CRP-like cAMP-binding protein